MDFVTRSGRICIESGHKEISFNHLLTYARAQLEPHKVLYVVEDAFSLFYGVEDGREIVVQEDHISGLFANVRP